ncbi:MAG: ATPase [Bryobacteraceae bacterium]
MRTGRLLAVAIVALAPPWAAAEVIDSASNGFTVKLGITIQAPPADVYKRLIHNVGDWWSSAHTVSGDAHNLSIEEKPMGCFCEKLPGGGSVRHMEVVLLAPGKAVGFSGGLGPLQAMAASGSMRFEISPVDSGSRLEVTYAVGGYLKAGLDIWAKPVDSVLLEQITRLKNYTEHGDPAPK